MSDRRLTESLDTLTVGAVSVMLARPRMILVTAGQDLSSGTRLGVSPMLGSFCVSRGSTKASNDAMSKEYASLAGRIIELVGGQGNINSAYHCQTRLRFALSDEGKVRAAELAETDGVVQTLSSGGVYQVVIGTHVKDVFDEIDTILQGGGHTPTGAPAAEKKGIFETILDFVSGTFQPIIPALSGAGMVKAVLALLVVFEVITRESQTYAVINMMADGVFYFLPILIAYTAATKLKSNPILAAGTAAMMLHPTWAGFVAEGEPVSLFEFIPLMLASYGGSVIPIILVILVQSYVEKWLNKVVPKSVNLVFVPMLTFLVMGPLALGLLGPIGAWVGGYLAAFFEFLSTNAAWAPPLIIGGLLPVMVMFGIHNAVAPMGIVQMAQTGYDSIFGPGALVSNIAQGVAVLIVAFRTKDDAKLKQIATAGGITALMGITEPALYGVNLPKRYPLIAAMIGGAAGGLYAGLTQTHRFATGSSGLPAVLLYIGDDSIRHLINIIVALAISVAVTTLMMFVLAPRWEKRLAETATAAADAPADLLPSAATTGKNTSTLVASKVTDVFSPCTGTTVALGDIADPVFSSGVMGPGLGIEPSDGRIVSPVNGEIVVAVKTGHAFGIRTDDGVEVLVHVGVDTVQMNGVGFSGSLTKGTRVEAGQTLVTADLNAIAAAGHPATVVLLVTNHKKFPHVTTTTTGGVLAGERVLSVQA